MEFGFYQSQEKAFQRPKLRIKMSLKTKILEIIQTNGPISVSTYMALCLYDEEFGYYRKSKPIGKDGDFITAPEISQLFGECVALFILTHWQECNHLEEINLIEFGPGRATLMKDILRVFDKIGSFNAKVNVFLIESNTNLQAIQSEILKEYNPNFIANAKDLPIDPKIPNYVLANEFLDCLPINQFIFNQGQWHEKQIGIKDGKLNFGLSPPIKATFGNAFDGATLEIAPALEAMIANFCDLVSQTNGAAIIFDYGYAQCEFANTFQALKNHQKCDVLENPGDCDLTAHVDFKAIESFANKHGVFTHGIISQAEFLQTFGINERAKQLIAKNPTQKDKIEAGLQRLLQPNEMGELFKTIILHL